MTQPERHGLKLPLGSRFIALAPVLMEPRVTSIEQFATQRGRSANELRRLNPGYTGGRVVAGVPRLVLMPLGVPQGDVIRLEAPPPGEPTPDALAATAAAEAQAADAGAPASPEVPEGATTPMADRANAAAPVPADVPVAIDAALVETASTRAQANVVLPTMAAPAAAAASAGDSSAATPATHRVARGDSLSSIAARYHVSVAQLRELNRIGRGDLVHPGDVLRLAP